MMIVGLGIRLKSMSVTQILEVNITLFALKARVQCKERMSVSMNIVNRCAMTYKTEWKNNSIHNK